MLALLAQLFAFHAAWGPPPQAYRPPPPALFSRQRAVREALWRCRERGFACRAQRATLSRGHVWRVWLDTRRRHHGGQMVVDLDAWTGALVGVHGSPAWDRAWTDDDRRRNRWEDDGWRRRQWDER